MAIVTLAAAARHLRTRARSTASESLAARLELSSYLVAVKFTVVLAQCSILFYTFVVISFQVAIFTRENRMG